MHRIRELAVQSANGIYTDEDRMQIQVEVSQLVDEVNRIASHAQFNGMNMLTGSLREWRRRRHGGAPAVLPGRRQHGPARARLHRHDDGARPSGCRAGAASTVSISTPDTANRAIGIVDDALKQVSRQRADLGAYQNRFEMAAKGVAVAAENMQAAESLIRDADMAAQMVEYTKNSDPDPVQHGDAGAGQPETQVGPAAARLTGRPGTHRSRRERLLDVASSDL